MNGGLAQVVALITYGNDFLSDPRREAPELFPSNSTFQYVSRLSFKGQITKSGIVRKAGIRAHDTATWFRSLKPLASNLRIAFFTIGETTSGPQPVSPNFGQRGGGGQLVFRSAGQPAHHHESVAFAGGGHWVIQADSEKGAELWRPVWSKGWSFKKLFLDRPRERIWSVDYMAMPKRGLQVDAIDLPVEEARKQLRSALNRAKNFSQEVHFNPWGEYFAEAVNLLDHREPTIPYHPDVLPSEFYSLSSRQVIAAAFKGWVFGGMGSWNDFVADSSSLKDEHLDISLELYRAILFAIATAVNSNTP